jgi:hypothetical protein
MNHEAVAGVWARHRQQYQNCRSASQRNIRAFSLPQAGQRDWRDSSSSAWYEHAPQCHCVSGLTSSSMYHVNERFAHFGQICMPMIVVLVGRGHQPPGLSPFEKTKTGG